MASVPEAGKFVLDPAGSEVVVQQKTMWGLVNVRGAFKGVDGVGEVHADGSAGGLITLDVGTLDTKNAKRDTHLRSADFFDTDQHPSIQLEVVEARLGNDSTVDVDGYLKVKGISKPISLAAKVVGIEGDAVTLSTEFAVDRAEFQLAWNQLGMIRGLAKVNATLRFVRSGTTDS